MLTRLAISAHQFLAQVGGFDDAPAASAPAAEPRRPMSFSDLQQGMRDVHSGKVDDSGFRNWTILLLIVIALIAIFIHMRQRKTVVVQTDSLPKLARELARQISFPLGTRLLLLWVARSTATPFAAILLSETLFNRCISQWHAQPTFSAARSWGRSRLELLRPELFDAPPAAKAL